jgi:hypothetical protein
MKRPFCHLCVFVLLLMVACSASASEVSPFREPVSHEIWNTLLQKHVNAEGLMNYKGMLRDSAQVNRYIQLLSSAHPQSAWSRAEQMAYWINAYNAFTVRLILDHYPIGSIKDIKRGIPLVNSVWDIRFIQIQGREYDLNQIEHQILRPVFKDARIHAAINCASFSCPRMMRYAFTAEKLEQQLDEAMRVFVNDPLRNRISSEKAEISAIFNWFGGDFKRDAGSISAYLNKYSSIKLSARAKISFIDYDWRLNEV